MLKKQLWVFMLGLPALVFGQKQKEVPLNYLDQSFQQYDRMQKTIWNKAELGFLETESSGILQDHLKENGFTVESGLAGMPTSFIATYGTDGPVIALLAEFDALPGISQDTVSHRAPLTENGGGHACGHNLFGTGSVAGAIAIKEWLESTGQKGTIKVYGTPAEEGGGGKVYLVRDGFFKNVDVVLDWHPASQNAVNVTTGTAIEMIDYTFHGKPAHAAGSPDKGRSALDGVEALDYMVNMLREHIPTASRIHYVISNGGEAPNIVPETATVSYYIRHPKREVLLDLVEWINQAAEGAALGTQTKVTREVVAGFYEKLPNRTLAKIMQKNLEAVGGIHYDERERGFAKGIVEDLGLPDSTINKAAEVKPLAEETPSQGGGSSDVGDVSWNVPTVSLGTASFVPGSPGHSWQNVASGGTTIGTKALINAAKIFALTAIDLYSNPELVEEVKQEFDKRRGPDFKYEALLGDRKPALDYRLEK